MSTLQHLNRWMDTTSARDQYSPKYHTVVRVAVRRALKNLPMSSSLEDIDLAALRATYLEQGVAAATAKSYVSMLQTAIKKFQVAGQKSLLEREFDLGDGRVFAYTPPSQGMRAQDVMKLYYHLLTLADDFLQDTPPDQVLNIPVEQTPGELQP